MGGRTALMKATSTAYGVAGMDTPHTIAPKSTSAYFATEPGTSRSSVASPTKGATQDKYATSLTTTCEWPILTVPPTLGPLDGEKDVNKGVMLRDTSCM
jgi:hypothetical protein